ncbi:MAG TPA: ABC transporter substrate-binding protein [Candidatus Limnocylindria bacterium]|nr:ABC transporter substrate-binding protein [Candidatus Limnocylindria bacterium]
MTQLRLTRRKLLVSGSALAIATACGGTAAPTATGTAAATGAAASGTATAKTNAALQAIIDKAKNAEGAQITLTWANYYGAGMAKDFLALFSSTYGFDAKVTNTPTNMSTDAPAIIQQFKANRPASTDVFMCTDLLAFQLERDGPKVGEEVDWSFSETIAANPKVLEHNFAVHILDTPRGITYNRDRLKGADVPKSMADVLQLSTKYAVASTPQASLFETLAVPDIWGEQKTIDYVTKLSKNLKGLIQGNELDRISSGEFDMLAIDFGKNVAQLRTNQGQPIGWSFPSDAPVLSAIYNVIPKNAVHPNMARLWINLITSREGQQVLYKNEFVDSPRLPGSKTAEDVKALEAQGFKVYATNLDFAAKNQDAYARLRPILQKIIATR